MKYFYSKFFIFLFTFAGIISCKSDDSGDGVEDFKAENRKSLGTSAEDLLSDDIYTKLTVELVFSDGFEPLDETVEDLRIFLTDRLNKTSINIIKTMIDSPTGAPFEISEIKAIEDEHRTQYTVDDNIAIYIFFSNGSSINDTETTFTLGTSYFNTSIVVYENTLKNLENDGNGELPILEGTTVQHEIGHLLGLVNILNDDIHPDNHLDPSNARHCVVENCLMYFESTAPGRLLQLRNLADVPQLDPLCIEDLQAKGGR